MISVNELALDIFEELAEYPEDYNVEFHQFDNGARLVDCGVKTKGGYLAGKRFTEICMGGLAEVTFRNGNINGVPMPFIDINTDFPAISCLGSQKAGWTVKVGNFFAMGSGPARALSLMPKHTFEVIEYEDDCDCAVICLESDKLPTEDVMEEIAKKCDVDVENVCAVGCCHHDNAFVHFNFFDSHRRLWLYISVCSDGGDILQQGIGGINSLNFAVIKDSKE